MVIETHKISALYYVKNPYRRDLDKFCTTATELKNIYNDPTTSYTPIVYEVEFYKAIPKFKKLSLAALKKLVAETLAENYFPTKKTTRQKPTLQKPTKRIKKCI